MFLSVCLLTVLFLYFISFLLDKKLTNKPSGETSRLLSYNTEHSLSKDVQNRTTRTDNDTVTFIVRSGNCLFHEEVAIIVPYRNRSWHLQKLKAYIDPFLKRQRIQYRLFVIELVMPTIFNRGYLLNVGFIIAKRIGTYRCFIFHDVDLIPTNNSNVYNCSKTPVHMSSGNSKFNFKVPYESYIGGVMMITGEQFQICNGFSNKYFGWGGEDDDFWKRLVFKKIKIKRLDTKTGRYTALSHGKDVLNPPNPERHKLLRNSVGRIKTDGLSTTKFEIVSSKLSFNYAWILVQYESDANVSQIFPYHCHL